MRTNTLQKLYDVHPSAQGAIQNAYGYAVFDNSDIQLGLIGGGSGNGLAIINSTGGEIFMKTGEGSVGIGLGVKNYKLISSLRRKKRLQASLAISGNGAVRLPRPQRTVYLAILRRALFP